MKDRLNRIKERESFRPVAPSVLAEEATVWFEMEENQVDMCAYMSYVFPVKDEAKVKIHSICHVDGSARLQTVKRDDNQIFYDLIRSFFGKSGIPMLINTSFNKQEPLVETPQDALNTFIKCDDIDTLAMGFYYIGKTGNEEKE